MLEIETIYQQTLQNIEKVKQLELENLNLRKQLQQLEYKLQKERGSVTIEVFFDEWGKKKFTNETVRSAEVQRLLDESNTYQELSIEVEKLDIHINYQCH